MASAGCLAGSRMRNQCMFIQCHIDIEYALAKPEFQLSDTEEASDLNGTKRSFGCLRIYR